MDLTAREGSPLEKRAEKEASRTSNFRERIDNYVKMTSHRERSSVCFINQTLAGRMLQARFG